MIRFLLICIFLVDTASATNLRGTTTTSPPTATSTSNLTSVPCPTTAYVVHNSTTGNNTCAPYAKCWFDEFHNINKCVSEGTPLSECECVKQYGDWMKWIAVIQAIILVADVIGCMCLTRCLHKSSLAPFMFCMIFVFAIVMTLYVTSVSSVERSNMTVLVVLTVLQLCCFGIIPMLKK